MKKSAARVIFCYLLIWAICPAYARFGIFKTKATFERKYPPEIHIPSEASVYLKVSSLSQSLSSPLEGQMAVSLTRELQAINSGPTVDSRQADIIFDVRITNMDLREHFDRRQEIRKVKVKEEKYQDENGHEKVRDIYEDREIPVTYLITNGSITINLQVRNAHSAQICYTNSFESSYYDSREAQRSWWNYSRSPNIEQASVQLTERIIEQIRPLFHERSEDVKVFLNVDEVLKPGNTLALRGQWEDARALWQSITTKSKSEAGRLYNVGASYEAIAYQSSNLPQALDTLETATGFYEKAARLDPEEKYYREGQKRILKSQEYFKTYFDWYRHEPYRSACSQNPRP